MDIIKQEFLTFRSYSPFSLDYKESIVMYKMKRLDLDNQYSHVVALSNPVLITELYFRFHAGPRN